MDGEIQKAQERRRTLESVSYDIELYRDRTEYMDSIAPVDEQCEEQEDEAPSTRSYTAPAALLAELSRGEVTDEELGFRKPQVIAAREDDYKRRRFNRPLSPARNDAFAMGNNTPDPSTRTYAEVMRDEQIKQEMVQIKHEMAQIKQEAEKKSSASLKRERVDIQEEKGGKRMKASAWDEQTSDVPSRWDATPLRGSASATPKRNRWDQTPQFDGVSNKLRSRWDVTPVNQGNATHLVGATPLGYTPGVTPMGAAGLATPTPGQFAVHEKVLTDEELDAILPEGYKVLEPPASYNPVKKMVLATPTPSDQQYLIPEEDRTQQYDVPIEMPEGLPAMKPGDVPYFKSLLEEEKEQEMSPEEIKERKIMKLLYRVKNGTPQQRKAAFKQLSLKAREFGAGPLFNQVLPLLMSPTLEDQERHLLVKVIDRILCKLDDLVRPYVHKILVVVEPLLIDQDYYSRVEGREIISNLSKAAGFAAMVTALRPDIDNLDEYVRNVTARALSVVASALGILQVVPFLRAVCASKKSWQARHTGIKTVQQIAILTGSGMLPHLGCLVGIVKDGLHAEDFQARENAKVKTITALALACLAEASAPYGEESFRPLLKPLLLAIRNERGKLLAALLKAMGFIICLMDPQDASRCTKEIMPTLIREFKSPDLEMKKIVLKVLKQCVSCEGVEADYIRVEVLPHYFAHFWTRVMALDRRHYFQVVETTVELAGKVGGCDIVRKVVDDLKHPTEPVRMMTMETIEKVVLNLGAFDIDGRLEVLLIDGMITALQEQTQENSTVIFRGFGAVLNALGSRASPYLPQVCGLIKGLLLHKSSVMRQRGSDLLAHIAVVISNCKEDKLLGHMGVVLFENLGEEYPDVLGSMIGALKAVASVSNMCTMTPAVKDMVPRLLPILKNRHEKVQENCIDLVGRIADRASEGVSPREWMRVCFELVELLNATKKGIRRAAVNTFGYVAKAVGPSDVLTVLLNNLKVQERRNRVCTTVAIAIVAETCQPFTVLPALMNEYRVPELNVQNGVLKSLSFMFEYIGEVGKDYIYAVAPLLEDALMDRDLVHRQTAASVVKHLALGVAGMGCEDVFLHLMNFLWPNIFETSPHLVTAVTEAIEGMRVALGAGMVLHYCLQGLFHPARKVRAAYWKIYNMLYIGSQDALVAAYPALVDDHRNNYSRLELNVFV